MYCCYLSQQLQCFKFANPVHVLCLVLIEVETPEHKTHGKHESHVQNRILLVLLENQMQLNWGWFHTQNMSKGCVRLNARNTHFSWCFIYFWLVGDHPAKGGGLVFSMVAMGWTIWLSQHNFRTFQLWLKWVKSTLKILESTWKYLEVLPFYCNIFLQGGGRKKKFAEDEDFDDSEEGSEMSDSEFEDPDEMEVGLNDSQI